MFDSRRGAWATFQFLSASGCSSRAPRCARTARSSLSELRAAAAIVASRLRQTSRSCDARAAAGSGVVLGVVAAGRKRCAAARSCRGGARARVRPRRCALAQPQPAVALERPRARTRSRRRRCRRGHSPSQSGRPTPRARWSDLRAGARRARRPPSTRRAPRTPSRRCRECAATANTASESTVMLGSARAQAMLGEQLVVVRGSARCGRRRPGRAGSGGCWRRSTDGPW